jgi:hypothetical protein
MFEGLNLPYQDESAGETDCPLKNMSLKKIKPFFQAAVYLSILPSSLNPVSLNSLDIIE